MHDSYKKWVDDGKPKVICSCGCGEEIIINTNHKTNGIRKHLRGHCSPWNKGKTNIYSEETLKKIRDNHPNMFGENNPFFGKYHTEETKQKIRDAEIGKIISEETKQKISNTILYQMKTLTHEEKSEKFGNFGEINSFFGKHHIEETKQKIRDNKPDISGENNPSWKDGVSFLPYCPKFNTKKKEEIRNEYNRKCYICGKDEKDNTLKIGKQVKLSVHHIDEDKEQGCNGKNWKLIPLCKSCHTKIHNNKIRVLNNVNY